MEYHDTARSAAQPVRHTILIEPLYSRSHILTAQESRFLNPIRVLKMIALATVCCSALLTATAAEAAPPKHRDDRAEAGAIIRVANFGAIGDGVHDDGPAITAAFAAAKADTGATSVEFEKKTYKLGDNPTAWHYFQMKGHEDLVIQGNGATLICAEGNLAFFFDGGRNITLRGLVFDTVAPSFTQGEVVAVGDDGSLDVKIMDGYPEPPDEAFLTANEYRAYGGGGRHMIVFEKGGAARNTRMPNDHLYIRNITRTSPGVFRFHVEENYLPAFKGVAVGNWVTYGFNKVDLPTATIAVKNKSGSIYAQIAANRVEHITFEEIAIHGSLNGGIRVSDMHGDVTLRNVRVVRKPGTPNLLSTISDALHLMNIRGKLTIEGCVIESPGDDCLNVGTLLEKVVAVSATDRKTLTLRTLDNRYYYYTIRLGDRLQFLNRSTGRVMGTATVAEVVFDKAKRIHRVTLDREIPGLDPETALVLNLNQMTSSTVIRDNTMKPFMRNAMLVRAQNMTIQGNRLDGSHGGVFGLNLTYSMGENARLRNIRMIGNTFLGPATGGIVLANHYRDEEGVLNSRGIEIIDNLFEVGTAKAIQISGVQDLKARDNIFRKGGIALKDGSEFTFYRNCVDAVIEH